MVRRTKKQKTKHSAGSPTSASEVTPDVSQQLASMEAELTSLDGVTPVVEDHIDSEMGVIEEVYCENFMCHRKLRVTLSPHVNFITGENGSGKSAIVAAIQICLGATARSTHRGKSIKNLIRHGFEGSALVRLTLRNDAAGSDSFRSAQFGRKIVVERVIHRDGSAEYRLKDEKGVLVSKLKSDLDAMLDHLNIQADNPCALLDQENAKLFLKDNPQDKYKFFLQSTDLYKMRELYSKIDDKTRTIVESTLKKELVKLATLRKAMDEAMKQWREAQSIQKLEEEAEGLQKELVWAFVCEKEAAAAKVSAKMEQKKRDAERAAEEYQEAKTAVATLERLQCEKNDTLKAIDAGMTEASQRKDDVRKTVREARRPLHSAESEMDLVVRSQQRVSQQLSRLQQALKKKKDDHDVMLRGLADSNLRAELERTQQLAAQTKNELHAAELRLESHPNELENLEDKLASCTADLRDAERTTSYLQHRLDVLQRRKTDRLLAFGNFTPRLQQLIHHNVHRFAAPPIGPLGLHVKLPERFKHFSQAIEVALKGTLGSYLVVNGRDKALLDDLKREVHCPQNQANIIISQRTGRRYGNLRLADGDLAAHAICNTLEVSDDEVFNALIDVCGAESKLLFEDRQSAEESVLSGSSGNFRMARFVSEVYLPSGDKFVVRSGNLAFIANKGNRRSSIICQDVEGEMKELEQKLDSAQENRQLLRHEEAKLRRDIAESRGFLKQEQQGVDSLSRLYNRQRTELHSIEEELMDSQQEHCLDTSVLDDEVKNSQDELEQFRMREQSLNQLISASRLDLEGPLRELEEAETMEKKVAAELDEAQRDSDASCKQLSQLKVSESMNQQENKAALASVENLQQQWRSIQAEAEEQADKALVLCARPAVSHSPGHYTKKIKANERQRTRAQQRVQGQSLGELENALKQRQALYEEKKSNFDKVRANLKRVRGMLEERVETWGRFRKLISQHTSRAFNKHMQLNNFVAKLKFLHEQQRLEIALLQNEKGASRASQVTDMKELSGGERSYTQVALLLALGQNAECPFSIMDEFDVFMDAVNRDSTVEQLVEAAKKNVKKQFIFVTPNDLSTLQPDPMVKIQKMDPPRDRDAATTE